MPKRRSQTSPVAATKKSKVPSPPPPVTILPPTTDNGKHVDEEALLLQDTEEDRIVIETETASSSSDEEESLAIDQVSDEDITEGVECREETNKNGLSLDGPASKVKLVGSHSHTDWVGYHATKKAFFEKFHLLYDSENNSEVNVKSIVQACKEVFSLRFTDYTEPSEKRLMVDQTIREYLLETLISNPPRWSRFLDLSIELTREEMCSPTAAIAFLTDLVELSSLEDCSLVFDFVETRLDTWKDPLFYVSGKNAVLRMCNDLLRRQSRAQNTVFCGRILIFLANYFPFSERSGLNIMSEFNADNVTKFKLGDETDDPDDKMEVVEMDDDKLFEGIDLAIPGLDKIVSLTQEEKKKKIKVDHNLYVKFWSLQDYFRTPNTCYNKISWKTFSTYTQDVLGAFHSFKLDDAGYRKRIERSDDNLPCINPIPKLGDENLYFAKYLTNRRLLELQMSDPAFRRYFLVQLLVILQYLTIPAKSKSEADSLSEDQLDFVKKTNEKIYELLSETPPHGREFVKCVKHILKREDLWNKWKNDGCQPFKKPVPPASVTATSSSTSEGSKDGNKVPDGLGSPSDDSKVKKKKKPRRRIGDSVKDASLKNRMLLGHAELSRLWNICPDNLEACRMSARNFVPQIDIFFAEAFKEMEAEPTPLGALVDPKREVKPKKLLGDPMYGWKALRLLARRSPYFFQMFGGAPISPLQNYLEYVLKKIKAERDPVPNPQEDVQTEGCSPNRKSGEGKSGDSQSNQDSENTPDGDQVMEATPAEDDEILRPEENKEASEDGDEEEGEVTDKLVRSLTEEEQRALGKGLGKNWLKLAAKLGFKADEIQFFQDDHKEEAAYFMLKNWTDQDEDATAADLIYQLEGMKLKELVAEVFKQ